MEIKNSDFKKSSLRCLQLLQRELLTFKSLSNEHQINNIFLLPLLSLQPSTYTSSEFYYQSLMNSLLNLMKQYFGFCSLNRDNHLGENRGVQCIIFDPSTSVF